MTAGPSGDDQNAELERLRRRYPAVADLARARHRRLLGHAATRSPHRARADRRSLHQRTRRAHRPGGRTAWPVSTARRSQTIDQGHHALLQTGAALCAPYPPIWAGCAVGGLTVHATREHSFCMPTNRRASSVIRCGSPARRAHGGRDFRLCHLLRGVCLFLAVRRAWMAALGHARRAFIRACKDRSSPSPGPRTPTNNLPSQAIKELTPIFTKRIGPQSGSGVLVAEGAAFPPRDGDRFGQAGLAEDG
jgi:hypothetical protein